MNDIIFSQNLSREVERAVGNVAHDRLFVLTDETTATLCWPLVEKLPCMAEAGLITIGATDENKTLGSLASVWEALQRGGASRHSLMLNLGGGMVTDLGGFAASTFKRGMAYVNIPTTLLSQVDASVGGKTGINFGGLKNEIGVFSLPRTVIIDTCFLRTLDHENILSGYAEMLKHALLSDEAMWARHVRFDLDASPDLGLLQQMVAESVAVKKRIVSQDPTEKGLRKALNLGHTVGHAFESLALGRHEPVLHGYAVAWGLVCELYLSALLTGFPKDRLQQTAQFVRSHYGTFRYDCTDYATLLETMTHDKKNEAGRINFTLLAAIGDIRIDQTASREQIMDALDFLREG